ncbi:hypothetical protein [Clostridium diolis]|uniref:hypothetical protein n=1 Tax=Clostridium diolis TaxID=223919 RepID=UPI00117E7AE3|nr:hypothetical protein [Clostridium diolis]
MRIMKFKNWRHVRVINLSDYREADSNRFYKKMKYLENNDKSCIHSVFSTKRRSELNKFFKNKTITIIVAWGINDKLNELI